MIYNAIKEKRDPKGFVVESMNTHIFVRAKFPGIYRIIKYKRFFKLDGGDYYTVFVKINGKVYQRDLTGNFCRLYIGTPKKICKQILSNNMLADRPYQPLARRYLMRYFPEELI